MLGFVLFLPDETEVNGGEQTDSAADHQNESQFFRVWRIKIADMRYQTEVSSSAMPFSA